MTTFNIKDAALELSRRLDRPVSRWQLHYAIQKNLVHTVSVQTSPFVQPSTRISEEEIERIEKEWKTPFTQPR